MFEMTCPWCEAQLPLAMADEAVEQTCPECLSSWCYEVVAEEAVPLAA